MISLLMRELNVSEIILISLAGLVVSAALVMIITSSVKARKKRNITGVVVKDEVRYSVNEQPIRFNTAVASFVEGDTVLNKGVTVVAGKQIQEGKFTVLSGVDDVNTISVKINGIVRDVANNTGIVLAKGDTICPVSGSIVLR